VKCGQEFHHRKPSALRYWLRSKSAGDGSTKTISAASMGTTAKVTRVTLVENCIPKIKTETFTIRVPIAHESPKVLGFITKEPRQKFYLPKAFTTVHRFTNEKTGETWLEVTSPSWFFSKNIREIARL
jgi:hypothetical protein